MIYLEGGARLENMSSRKEVTLDTRSSVTSEAACILLNSSSVASLRLFPEGLLKECPAFIF
jgi:hypothetical protein